MDEQQYMVALVAPSASLALSHAICGHTADYEQARILVQSIGDTFNLPGLAVAACTWIETMLGVTNPGGPVADGRIFAGTWYQQEPIGNTYTQGQEYPPDELTPRHRLVEYLVNARANADTALYGDTFQVALAQGEQEFSEFIGLVLNTCANTIRIAKGIPHPSSTPGDNPGDDAR